jgi:hypothetical protein
MEAEGNVTTPVARKKRRKRSPRPLRYRGRLKRPGVAQKMKEQWADPEYRARMTAKRKEEALTRTATREGVPDGMRKAQAYPLNEAAKESAKQTMAELETAGVLVNDSDAAKEALQTSIEIMRKPGEKKVQLAAARQVLEWTKAKPASKSEVTVNKAEEWLKAVADQDDDDKGEAPKDA